MQDFQDRLTIKLAGKNHYALIAFLKKHGGNGDSEEVSRFVEEAIAWRILDREMAFRHADTDEEAGSLMPPAYSNTGEALSA